MLEAILPAAVAVVATRGDLDPPCFPAEEELIARAVESRRREFLTGRACAHRALALLGSEPRAIVAGLRGEPYWPDGFLGSITHCRGYRAAAVARATAVLALGVDAEPHEPLPPGVLAAIGVPEERAAAAATPGLAEICWDRILFSAKESIYKALDPLAPGLLGFGDASVRLDPACRTFVASLSKRVPGLGSDLVDGRWSIIGGIVVTSVCVFRSA